MVYCAVKTFSRKDINRFVAKPFCVQLNRGRNILCPRSRLRVWSLEKGPAVPSRVSLLILHTQADSGAYSRTPLTDPAFRDRVHLFCQQPSGQSRVYRITQLRTDDVYRESVGTRPVVLKW